MSEIQVTRYAHLPLFDDRTALRYMGAHAPSEEVRGLYEDCKRESVGCLDGAICHRIYDITTEGTQINFGDFCIESADLARCLGGCRQAVVMVATAGFPIDRLIKKYSAVSPARALAFSAIGTAYVEGMCDDFCTALCRAYGGARMRYGVGYGDLSLDCQADIFSCLEVTKRIGVTLTEGMLMSPTKSVSAIIGVGGETVHNSYCRACPHTDCAQRGVST